MCSTLAQQATLSETKCPGAHAFFTRSALCPPLHVLTQTSYLQVPLQLAIRETSDAGTPIVAYQPDSPSAQAYQCIAKLIYDKLQQLPTQLQPPLLGSTPGVT